MFCFDDYRVVELKILIIVIILRLSGLNNDEDLYFLVVSVDQ